jgi:hypothetical protein
MTRSEHRIRPLLRRAGMLLLGSIAGTALHAQPVTWETTYGSQTGFDDAGGIALSKSCPSRYAIAGRAQTAQGTSDLYIFVADENGSTAARFEKIYDLNGLHGQDQGGSIRQTGDGFIVTATTDNGIANGPQRLVLLKLTCDGTVSWVKTYGDSKGDYAGRDVLVNDDGDYTAAGWRKDRKSGLREAFLLRVSSTGTLRWQHAFRGTRGSGFTSDNGFYAIAQDTKTPGQVTGDITAVGFTTRSGEGRDAWVVRVDGVTGLFGAAQQGGAYYSSPDHGDEDFNAVRELQIPPETGRLVYAGHTNFLPGGIDDIYLAKSALAPWAALLNVVVGDNGGLWFEYGMSFVEMKTNTPFSQAGDLALTGVAANYMIAPVVEAFDAFLLKIDKSTLGPTNIGAAGTPGWYYGDHGQYDDGGYGIVYDDHLLPQYVGFAIIGFSKSNLERATPADPNDAYLIKTDPLGKTGCETAYRPYHQDVPYLVQQDTLEYRDPAQEDSPTVVAEAQDWGVRVCGAKISSALAASPACSTRGVRATRSSGQRAGNSR